MFEIPARDLYLFSSEQADKIRRISDLYKGVKYCWVGLSPRHWIPISPEMNSAASYFHFVEHDHSVGVYTYECPEESYERNLPPHLRTYIFTDPPSTVLFDQTETGSWREVDWASSMLEAKMTQDLVDHVDIALMNLRAKYKITAPKKK